MSALFRSASTSSFDRLYRQHAASVYRYARAVLGSHADAEDVTQQTFLNAYRALAQGTKPRKAENWLFTIAHNEVRRHLRDNRPARLEVELDEELEQRTPERTEPSVADVLRALQQLTPNQRSALVMREFEGRSYAEISEVLGVTPSALETLMFRARRALAEALEDALTCSEAELAVSRRLDGRLSRREARRLKAHMRECGLCKGFEVRQRRQRSLLKGLSVIPVPASLFAFRGEQAAAAVFGAAATGGSAGIAVKAAAVVTAVTVAGGVGYKAGADRLVTPEPAAKPVSQVAPTPARKAPVTTPPVASPTSRIRAAAAARANVSKRKAQAGRRALVAKAAKRKVPAASQGAGAEASNAAKSAERPAQAQKEKAAQPQRGTPTRRRAAPQKQAKPRPEQVPAQSGKAKVTERPQPPQPQTTPQRARPELPAGATPVLPVTPGQDRQLADPKPEKSKP